MNKSYFFFIIILLVSGCGGSLQKDASVFYERSAYQAGIDFFKKKFDGQTSRAVNHFYIHRHILYFYHKLGKLHDGLIYYSQFKDRALRLYAEGVYNEFLNINTKALKLLEEAATLRPREFIIHYDLALVKRALKKYGSARRSLARCLKLNDDYGPAYYEMGMHYAYGRRQFGIGRAFLKEAADRYSDFGKEPVLDVKISLGKVLLRENKIDDAVSTLQDVAKANFHKLIRSVDLGDLYVRQGEPDRARDYWTRALSILGHNSLRGRYYFFRLNGLKQGGVDLSGVAYGYITTLDSGVESFVFADEEDFFFDNKPTAPLTYKKLLSSGLSDGKVGWDVWIVEYAGIMSKAQPLRRFVQKRGLVKKLLFKDARQLLISVQKKKVEIGKTKEPGSRGTDFWCRSDARIGVFTPTSRGMVTLRFPCYHFHRAFICDINGDGREDIVASGFDAAGRLLVKVFLDRGRGRWAPMRQLTESLASRDNGYVFIDLDGKPGLELVRYSDVISWADVFRQKGRRFVKDNTLYAGFAVDYFNSYQFFVPGYTASLSRKRRLTPATRTRYRALERHLPLASSILKRSAHP